MSEDINRSIRIYLNTTDANKKYDELTASTERLTQKLNDLQREGKANGVEFNKVKSQLDSNIKQQGLYEAKIKETTRVLKNLSGATRDELNAQSKYLRQELGKSIKGTEKYTSTLEQLRRVEAQRTIVMNDMNGAMTKQESGFSRLANRINKYGTTIMGAAAALTGISLTLRKSAQDAAHMDDVYSDVMKTTGLTKDEVLDLNESLKAMDTRTSRENLNNLARDAGKLGISGKENLLKFVEGANQIKVALGEDLGEDAIQNIGKMAEVYAKSTDILAGKDLKERMLAVGSAVNEIGATSSANEPYLVEFAARLGGVATQAGISMDAILGYGSALDQDMQAVEMSATALQNFIMKLMGDPAKFARLAGLEVSSFTKLLSTDANAAIKQVLAALNQKGGFQALIPIFKDMGLDGARAVGVLSSMASSIDKVEAAQVIANKAMTEGVSITKEYDTKNNNLQAQLEKAQKAFMDASEALGNSLSPMLLKSTKATTYLVKGLSELGPWLSENKGLIITLAVAWGVYALALTKSTVATKVSELASKANVAWKATEKTVVLAASVAYNTLTGNTTRAAAAQKMLKATMAETPWGAILVAVTAIGVGIYKWATYETELEKSLRKTNAQIAKETTEAERLFSAAKNAAIGSKDRAKYIGIINEKYGEYLPKLLNEKTTTEELSRALTSVNIGLQNKIALQMRDAAIEEQITKSTEKQAELVGSIRKNLEQQLGGNKELVSDYMSQLTDIIKNTSDETYVATLQDFYKKTKLKTAPLDMFSVPLANLVTAFKKSNVAMKQEIAKIEQEFDPLISKTNQIKQEITDDTSSVETKKATSSSGSVDAGYDKASEEKKAYEKLLNDQKLLYDNYKSDERKKLNANLITTEQYNLNLAKLDVELYEKKGKLLESFKPQFAENQQWIKQLSQETADDQIGADENLQLKQIELLKQKRDKTIEERDKELALLRDKAKDDYAHGRLTEEEYNQELARITFLSLTTRLDAHQQYQTDIKEQVKSGTKIQVEALKEAELATAESLKNMTQAELDALIEKRKLLAQYQTTTLADRMAEELRLVKAKLGQTEAYEIAKKAIEEKYANERYQMAASIGLASLLDQYANEMAALEKHLAEMGATEKEAEQARANVKLKYAQQFADQIAQIANAGSAFTQALQSSETANLDAEYEKRLSALTKSYNAGIISQEDYNNQKTQLDYEQKVDALEIEKKYADANFAMQAASVTVSMAQGIMAAWASSMMLGPVAGPIAAGILTALLVGTGIAQIAQANAEREKIKAMTIEAPASSSSSGSVSRVALPQAKEGRYNVIGADDGKAYDNVEYVGPAKTGIIHTPTLVGEAGSELIVDHPTLSNIRMNAPWILEEIQRARTPQRAKGNYSGISDVSAASSADSINLQLILAELRMTIDQLVATLDNGIEAPIVITELEKKMLLMEKSKNKGRKS